MFLQKYCPFTLSTLILSEEENEKDEIIQKEKETVGTKAESHIEGSQDTQSKRLHLLAKDLYLELDIIHHRASLKLQQLNAGKTHGDV